MEMISESIGQSGIAGWLVWRSFMLRAVVGTHLHTPDARVAENIPASGEWSLFKMCAPFSVHRCPVSFDEQCHSAQVQLPGQPSELHCYTFHCHL